MRHASANEAQPEQRTYGGNLCPNSVPPAPTVLPVIHAPCGRLIKDFKDKIIQSHICTYRIRLIVCECTFARKDFVDDFGSNFN